MRRTSLLLLLALSGPFVGIILWLNSLGQAGPVKAAEEEVPRTGRIPLTQVVLFNTGVGYFQREGPVEGSPRLDLSFPVTDINDLLKSLIVDDGGKPGVISYDGGEPTENVLSSFALNLGGNPTFGQLLNQARGERVEVSLEGGNAGNAGLTGVIVGMEAHQETSAREIHHLNLLTSDGVRRLPIDRIQRLRFLNAALEEEFRRALGTLAASHNTQRRNLSFHLRGEGKRKIKIGYVVDTPIWKSSYRLALSGKDGKPGLQAWAIVQNTTEEDWKDVRMALVSGRPISFTMDLAQPLFVPRPPVNPEVYASLQPPMFQGNGPGIQGLQLGGGLQGLQGGLQGGVPPRGGRDFNEKGMLVDENGKPIVEPGGHPSPSFVNRYQLDLESRKPPTRLSYEELMLRQNGRAQARAAASTLTGDPTADSIAVDIGRIGEDFRLTLDQSVTLPRQKSALLPLYHGPVAITRFSIYNHAVHPRFPLLGVKLKNTSGHHLVAGPVAVYDKEGYVGDCKLPNLQPNEERLVSYAMDLGLEIRDEHWSPVEVVNGITLANFALTKKSTFTKETKYRLNNRSTRPRTLLVDHPKVADWKVIGENRSIESTKDHERFEWKVIAGKISEQVVTEEMPSVEIFSLHRMTLVQIQAFAESKKASKPVQQALLKALGFRERLLAISKEAGNIGSQMQAIIKEQERLRANITRVPKGSPAHKRYLDKFEQQEIKIEKFQATLQEKKEAAEAIDKQFEAFLDKLVLS